MKVYKERTLHTKPNADDNGISCGTADEDGIMITEKQNGNGIYIYYSEIENMVQQMRKLLYEKRKGNSEDSVQAKEVQTCSTSDFKNLSAYYASDEWKALRLRRLTMDAHRCVNCGSRVGLEVHHMSYVRVGCESVGDLRTLCGCCHRDVTELGRRRRGGRFYG